MSSLITFKDIVDRISETVGVQTSDLGARHKIKTFVNMAYVNEVAPQKPWKWLKQTIQVVHKAFYAAGTVAVTPESTTVTLSVAPNVSLGSFKGFRFSVSGSNKVYTLATHTAGSTSAVLTSPYQESLDAAAEYKVWRDRVDLPTTAKEVTSVWHAERSKPLDSVGPQGFRKYEASSPKEEGFPALYNTDDFFDPSSNDPEAESDRYRRLQIYPSVTNTPVTINIDCIQEVVEMEGDTDEPLMPVGDRIVLYYYAGAMAWSIISRNEEMHNVFYAKGEKKLAKMVGDRDPGIDQPTLQPKSSYLSAIRRTGLKSRATAVASLGGNSSINLPTYLSDVTIDGANIIDDVTVVIGKKIDGRDISADGLVLDQASADIAAHIANTVGAHTASAISSVPTGNLASTTVQTALNELQGDLDALNTLANGKIYVGNVSNVATEVTPTGDITIANDGTTAISSGVIVNADINTSAAIAYSKLNLATSIVNGDVAVAAAIAHSKMAAHTVSRALVSDGSGVATPATTTATEIGYVNLVTGPIQAQIDGKQPIDSDLTAVAGLSSTGLIVRTGTGTASVRTITAGSSKISMSNGDGVSGNPTVDVAEANLNMNNTGTTLGIAKGGTGQVTKTAAFDALSPMTTTGDIITGGSSGTGGRLAIGSPSQVLTVVTGVPAWAPLPIGSTTGVTFQTFTSGTAATYTTPANVKWIRVIAVGQGGGGGGSATQAANNAGNGTTGSSTTFGTSLITAIGGGGGAIIGVGGVGGGGTISAPAIGFCLNGTGGGASAVYNGSSINFPSAIGGGSSFGGGAPSQYNAAAATAGINGTVNRGGGGGGALINIAAGLISGPGGGGGGTCEAVIINPSATYTYTVGSAAGGGGTAGTSGAAGGSGGSGIIIVEEHYNY